MTDSAAGGIEFPETTLGSDPERLDLPPDEPGIVGGCTAVDLLFVLDNSASMQTHHKALADAFPTFITAIFERLPHGTDVHVGLTTTDVACKGPDCTCEDSTVGCQTAATSESILSVYAPPEAGSNGVNGSQGRLIRTEGLVYFEASTVDDPADLIAWFTASAESTGEDGCSFEMPVAAAGFVADPANAGTNAGFIRDAGAALVVFVLTDESDKSPELVDTYINRLRQAKKICGGDVCISAAAILPSCVTGEAQSLWRFLTAFGEDPIVGDITDPSVYAEVIQNALAIAVTSACAGVPVP